MEESVYSSQYPDIQISQFQLLSWQLHGYFKGSMKKSTIISYNL